MCIHWLSSSKTVSQRFRKSSSSKFLSSGFSYMQTLPSSLHLNRFLVRHLQFSSQPPSDLQIAPKPRRNFLAFPWAGAGVIWRSILVVTISGPTAPPSSAVDADPGLNQVSPQPSSRRRPLQISSELSSVLENVAQALPLEVKTPTGVLFSGTFSLNSAFAISYPHSSRTSRLQ